MNYYYKTGVVDEDRGFMQGRTERKIGDQVIGSYEYADGHVKVKVLYKADDRGYRVLKEERTALKPLKRPKEPKVGKENHKPSGRKHRAKTSPKTKTPHEDKFSSSYSSDIHIKEQSKDMNGYEMQTHHGSGYSMQGFVANMEETRPLQNNGNSYTKYTSETPAPPMESLEDSKEQTPEKSPVSARPAGAKRYKGFWRKTGNSTKKSKTQPDDGLAIFYKELYPLRTVLFSPYEAVSPVRRKVVDGSKYFEPVQTTEEPENHK